MQSRLAYCPAWSDFWDLWRKSWTDWAQYTYQWQRTANNLELWLCGSVPDCSYHCPSSTLYPLKNDMNFAQRWVCSSFA